MKYLQELPHGKRRAHEVGLKDGKDRVSEEWDNGGLQGKELESEGSRAAERKQENGGALFLMRGRKGLLTSREAKVSLLPV